MHIFSDDNLIVLHMNFDCDYNIKSSSRYHHSESCTKLNYVYTSRQCDEYFEYLEELRRIIFGQRYPEEMSSATVPPQSHSIHYHTPNGRTLVYQIKDASDYGITLSPIPSETETLVTETFHAKEHVLARPETSEIIPRKLCHQFPSNIEERMRNCLHSSSEVINSYLSDSRELFSSMPYNDYAYNTTSSETSHLEKFQSAYYLHDYSDDEQDFNDFKSLSDGLNESFAVVEDFAKVLEETDSVFEEVDCDGFDDRWSISDDKVRRIVGIVKRHNERPLEQGSYAEVIECPHPTVYYAENQYPDGYMEELLSDKISLGNDLQLPSIFNRPSMSVEQEQKNFTTTIVSHEPQLSPSSSVSSDPTPLSRKSSETATSGNGVLVNMIQDYVKMVMDVSRALSQSSQAEAPEGLEGEESDARNENSVTLVTKDIEQVTENLEKDNSIDLVTILETENDDSDLDENNSDKDNIEEPITFGPIAPRKSSVEKWESVTLRAERLNSGEYEANHDNEPEENDLHGYQDSKDEICSSKSKTSLEPTVLSESHFNEAEEFSHLPDYQNTGMSQSDDRITVIDGVEGDSEPQEAAGSDDGSDCHNEPADDKKQSAAQEVIEKVDFFRMNQSSDCDDNSGRNDFESDSHSQPMMGTMENLKDLAGEESRTSECLCLDALLDSDAPLDSNAPLDSDAPLNSDVLLDSPSSGLSLLPIESNSPCEYDIQFPMGNTLEEYSLCDQDDADSSTQQEEEQCPLELAMDQSCVEDLGADVTDSSNTLTTTSKDEGKFSSSLFHHQEEQGSIQEEQNSILPEFSDIQSDEPLDHVDVQNSFDEPTGDENEFQTEISNELVDIISTLLNEMLDKVEQNDFQETNELPSFVEDVNGSSNVEDLYLDNDIVSEEGLQSYLQCVLDRVDDGNDIHETNELPSLADNVSGDLHVEDVYFKTDSLSEKDLQNYLQSDLDRVDERSDFHETDEVPPIVDDVSGGLHVEEICFETEKMSEEDLRSFLQSVLDQLDERLLEHSLTANRAISTKDDLRDGLEHDPSSLPVENLPDNIMNKSVDQSDPTANIFQDGNGQETDTEIANTLDCLLTRVSLESEQACSAENLKFKEQHQEPVSQEPIQDDTEKERAVDTGESLDVVVMPIGVPEQQTRKIQHPDSSEVDDVLERNLDVSETLEYLTQTVSSFKETDTVTEENDVSICTVPSNDVVEVLKGLITLVDNTLITSEKIENYISTDNEDQISNILEDLLLSVCTVQHKEDYPDSVLGIGSSVERLEHKNAVDMQLETYEIGSENNHQQSNQSIVNEDQAYTPILLGTAEMEMIIGGITEVIISVVCLVQVVEEIMEDVVKMLESVSNTERRGLEDSSGSRDASIVDGLQSVPVLLIDNEDEDERVKQEDCMDEYFDDELGCEMKLMDVQECVFSIVSVLEVVESLLGAVDLMDTEYHLEEEEENNYEPISNIVDQETDLCDTSSAVPEDDQHSKEVKKGMPNPPDTEESNQFDNLQAHSKLVSKTSNKHEECEQHQSIQNDHPTSQPSSKKEDLEHITSTLDDMLLAVEVVGELMENVLQVEEQDEIEIVDHSNEIPSETISIKSEVITEEGDDIEENTGPIVTNLVDLKETMKEVNIEEDDDQIKHLVCIESSQSPSTGEIDKETFKLRSVQQGGKNVEACLSSLNPEDCEIFYNSLRGTNEPEPELEAHETDIHETEVSSTIPEVCRPFEPSLDQAPIDNQNGTLDVYRRETLDGGTLKFPSSVPETQSFPLNIIATSTPTSDFSAGDPQIRSDDEDSISVYLERLVDHQLLIGMTEASHFLIASASPSSSPCSNTIIVREFYQDCDTIITEEPPIDCSPDIDDEFSLSETDSQHDSEDTVIFNPDISPHDQNSVGCFEETVDDNQNFEMVISPLQGFQNPSASETHVSSSSQFDTSENSLRENLTETPVLTSSFSTDEISNHIFAPEVEQGRIHTERIMNDESDDEAKSNKGTCQQQLQLERAKPTLSRQNLETDYDLIPESSNCSLCVDTSEPVPTNSSQKLPSETSSSLKSLEQPTTSSVLEEVSHFLQTACVAALVYMSPSESAPFNSEIIEDAAKYISSPEPKEDNQ